MATSKENQGRGVQGGTPEQHAEAGRQSHKNTPSNQSKGSNQSGSSKSGGTQGGSSEQHSRAGREGGRK